MMTEVAVIIEVTIVVVTDVTVIMEVAEIEVDHQDEITVEKIVMKAVVEGRILDLATLDCNSRSSTHKTVNRQNYIFNRRSISYANYRVMWY